MANLQFTRPKLSTWRKIACGTWKVPGDPSVYGNVDFNVKKLLDRREKVKASGRTPATITVIVARAMALTLKRYPQMNGMIRWGTIYLRQNVSLFIQTAVDEDGKELSGVVIEKAEEKSLDEIGRELALKAKAIREDKDPTFKQTKSTVTLVPTFLLGRVLTFLSFILYTLNINLKILGLPNDPFGSAMITSVGAMGIDEAYAPLVPYSRVPLLICIGATRDQAIVEDGKIVIAPIVKLCVTFDHRFMDGVYGAKMLKFTRALLETDDGLDQLGLA